MSVLTKSKLCFMEATNTIGGHGLKSLPPQRRWPQVKPQIEPAKRNGGKKVHQKGKSEINSKEYYP